MAATNACCSSASFLKASHFICKHNRFVTCFNFYKIIWRKDIHKITKLFVSLDLSPLSIFKFPAIKMLSHLFTASSRVSLNSSKISFLFLPLGSLYAYIINHFLLEMLSSKHIVSDLFVSNFFILFTLTKMTFPHPCLSISVLNGGN